MNRVCIYPKDVSIITGKSVRNAQRTLKLIRIILKKRDDQYITIAEFADFSGIDVESIQKICR